MISEDSALVEFVRDAEQNNFKSAQEGRPIFEDKDFVRIMTPGDTRTTIYREASAQDKRRFPQAWDLYQRGMAEVTEGTPLAEWAQITASQVRELQHVNVRTVEEFVSVSDSNIQRMGPGYAQLQRRAQQYLESSTDDAAATAAARENEQLRDQLALMQEQIDALKAQAAATDADKSDPAAQSTATVTDEPKRNVGGRPRKAPEAAE